MKRLTLALVLLTGCASLGPVSRDDGFDMRVRNHHADDVIVYLDRGTRQRLGRVAGAIGKRTFHLSAGTVQSRPMVLVCVGNWTPHNSQCYRTDRIVGSYPGDNREPGVIFLTIQRGVGGVVAQLNG